MIGAQALVEAPEDAGVACAFGLPGVHNLPAWAGGGAQGARVEVGADAVVLRALNPLLGPGRDVAPVAARLEELCTDVRAWVAADEPQALELLDTLARVLPDGGVLVADLCIPGSWAAALHRTRCLAFPMGWSAGDEVFGVELPSPDFVALEPSLVVAAAALRPPPTMSPRWHRRAR